MKADSNSHTGRIGVVGTQLLFKRLGWIFREQTIEDYGIDAHIEVVENNIATGKLIALQIKSGKSWFEERVDNGFVFRGKREHLEYWQKHSLPVLIVLYNDEEEIAYWQAVNSSNVQSTNKAWKLIVPFKQQVNVQSIEKIFDFFKKFTAPNAYTTLSLQDVSHGGSKRYSANIILNGDYTKFEIIEIIRKVIVDLKTREYYKNNQAKSHLQGKEAQVIFLFLYLSLDDVSSVNWICRTQWINKKISLKSSSIKMEGEIIDNETVVDWNKNYAIFLGALDSGKLTKEEYLDVINSILNSIKPIISRIIELTELFNKDFLDESSYIDNISKLEPVIKELSSQSMHIGSAPTECSDLNKRFQGLIAIAYNIVLPFSKKGLETWEERNRNYLARKAINDYQKELLRLEFEFEKIH